MTPRIAPAFIVTSVLTLFGCASAPPTLTRDDVIGLPDQQVCLAYYRYRSQQGGQVVIAEYERRISLERFTAAQCDAFFNQYIQAKARADGAAVGKVAGEVLGMAAGAAAIGAAGYYGAKWSMPTPAGVTSPPARPLSRPIGVSLMRQHNIYSNGLNQVLCDYGIGGQVILPFGSTCPTNYPY